MFTTAIDHQGFEALLRERYPEVELDFISYTGSNATAYVQYLLERGKIPDIYITSVFGMREEQREYLLDLSGYAYLNGYRTANINQVALEGAVYLVPANLEELKALSLEIRAAGLDPAAAQFELPGNGFFDLFILAKTDFLSTPAGLQWERDFQNGSATAAEGLSGASEVLQELIDCGLFDAAYAQRDYDQTINRFYGRQAAMYVNAGTVERFTQNEDGTGDQYGILPYFGADGDSSVLITQPTRYFGLSKELAGPGNEQKLEDALKVMSLMATEEGQRALARDAGNYVTPLKNVVIPEESPFHAVGDLLQNGHTSTLAYAGYEAIVVGVGEKVRDRVAGRSTGDDVLALLDALQAEYLAAGKEPAVAVAAQDFTQEETAQLQAEALRLAAGTDVGMVSLGACHDGVENFSGACDRIFKGDISQAVVSAIVPNFYNDPVCVLTLTGGTIRDLLETGYPAGITVRKNGDGTAAEITLPDGAALDEGASYTVAVDQSGFTDEIGELGKVRTTELVMLDVVSAYFGAHSPLYPLAPSLK